jgi:hypothetical protein
MPLSDKVTRGQAPSDRQSEFQGVDDWTAADPEASHCHNTADDRPGHTCGQSRPGLCRDEPLHTQAMRQTAAGAVGCMPAHSGDHHGKRGHNHGPVVRTAERRDQHGSRKSCRFDPWLTVKSMGGAVWPGRGR